MDAAHTTLAELIDRSRQLYTLPGVALRVLELTDNPQVDAVELKSCIENDPALATKVLRVVNSSLFGLAQRVSNLGQALALLGTKPLKLLVLGFSLPEPLFVGIAGDLLAAYWKHTLTRAVAARELCERLRRPGTDELFLAGLLKDLGRLVLMQGLGKPYIDLLRQGQADPREMRELERRLLGFDHLRLTGALLEQWRLPTSLVEAVQLPDDADERECLPADRRSLADILHAAEGFAELLADGQTAALAEIVSGPLGRQLDREALVSLLAAIERTVAQLADVLSVDLSHGIDHSAVLARVYTQLAGAAEAAVEDWLTPPRITASAGRLAESEAALALSVAIAERGTAGGRWNEPHVAAAAQSRGPAAPSAHSSGSHLPQTAHLRQTAALRPSDVDAELLARIATAAALCRQARRELSLLLARADGDDRGQPDVDAGEASETRHRVEAELAEADPDGLGPLTLADGRWALVLPGYDRRAAGDVGHQLLRQTRAWAAAGVPASLSVGISTADVPAKNFRPLDLIRSAERCLGTAQLSGGNCVKSIESC
jgi:HD-like signal output (HDOD) protein